MQVNAVKQRAGNLPPIFGNLAGTADAFFVWVGLMAAGAWIHRADQNEVGRKFQCPGGSGNGDDSVFQGLTQGFQNIAVKFGQLVQKQNASVGQRDLSRLGMVAAAHQRRRRSGVMGMAKRPLPHQWLVLF